MPLVIVYGLTEMDYKEERIGQIEANITKEVVAIEELDLTPEGVSFSFPRDPSVVSDEIPITIIVELLFDKPERTQETRDVLAHNIAFAFKQTVESWRVLRSFVEVAVKRFDPEKDGFYTDSIY